MIALWISCLVIILAGFVYYPKYQQSQTEATLSWDVSGYYMYLPALFIYQDLKNCSFRDDIIEKYHPTHDFHQAFEHSSGNYVMKHSCGQALQYLPFFGIAHFWASNSTKYEADGFSFPYQFLISIGSLLVALLGLFFLRRLLLLYFEDWIVALTLLCIVLGTNYLDYSAINGAMTHNNLFTIYTLIIYTTFFFYKKPTYAKGMIIGGLIGLAALTRPIEIISCIIPIAWGVNLFSKAQIEKRFSFIMSILPKAFLAIISCLAIGFIQLLYWKYVTDEWIVYSYQSFGFSWLHPHIFNGLFSYKSGWLVYTPLMIFGLIGFIPLYKYHRSIWGASIVFIIIFIYIVFAWDIWWYGGSLGQRTMVQAYPVLAFPLASFILWIRASNIWYKVTVSTLLLIFIYSNLWFTHQAHRGGLLHAGQMTNAYFWKVLGKYEKQQNDLKLLDTNEEFTGERTSISKLLSSGFEEETFSANCKLPPIQGVSSLCLNETVQYSPTYYIPISSKGAGWVRASADFKCDKKEGNIWRMTHFIIRFYDQDEIIKERWIRVQRLLTEGQTSNIFIDAKYPEESFSKVGILFWNGDGDKEILIDNLILESYL